MNLSCTHCGKTFTITAEQLGTRGKCPHCKATIILPRAASGEIVMGDGLRAPGLWMERWFSLLGAVCLHLLVFGIIALIPYRYLSVGETAEGEEVVLGQFSTPTITNNALQDLPAESTTINSQQHMVDLFSDQMVSSSNLSSRQLQDVQALAPSAGQQGDFDLRTEDRSGDSDEEFREFEQLVAQMRQDGLEIVITFDSTGSMEGEIQEVKNKIERMGNVLFRMIPKTRISVCTYRDVGARYVVQGLPLTDNLGDIVNFLESISAAGGGDDPEAVNAGLEWAIQQNQFRPAARKVILLFGDAPPHAADHDYCLRLSSEFRRKYHGVISTVTCHSGQRLPAFIEIAQMGGGEAFLTRNEREIMTQLIILVFGSKYREKVLEAFHLLDR
ncbi:MAG: vWA domain-containing protein [Pirellulaceae bacterium]